MKRRDLAEQRLYQTVPKYDASDVTDKKYQADAETPFFQNYEFVNNLGRMFGVALFWGFFKTIQE